MFLPATINNPQASVQTSCKVHGLTLASEVNRITQTLEVSCTFTYFTHYPLTQPTQNQHQQPQADQGHLYVQMPLLPLHHPENVWPEETTLPKTAVTKTSGPTLWLEAPVPPGKLSDQWWDNEQISGKAPSSLLHAHGLGHAHERNKKTPTDRL